MLGFLLRTVVIFGLLVGPWLDLQHAYSLVYRVALARFVEVLPLDRPVWLRECRASEPRIDTCVQYLDEVTGEIRTNVHRGGHLAFMATALLVALVLATPIRWLHRCAALLIGMFALCGYLALRLGAHFCLQFASQPLSWFPLSLPDRNLLLFVVAYPPWYLAPVLIWVAGVSRRVYLELVVSDQHERLSLSNTASRGHRRLPDPLETRAPRPPRAGPSSPPPRDPPACGPA